MNKVILTTIFAALLSNSPLGAEELHSGTESKALAFAKTPAEKTPAEKTPRNADPQKAVPVAYVVTDFSAQESVPPSPLGTYSNDSSLNAVSSSDVGSTGGCSMGGCSTGGCSTGGCSSGCECADCCQPFWTHRTSVFGEYLLLRPRNFDVAYVEEINGPSTNPQPIHGLQNGPIADTYMDVDSAGRVGFMAALSPCASLGATYTYFETTGSDELTVTGTNQLRSLVDHPLATNAASDWVHAEASHYVQFQLADVEYRWLYSAGRCHAVNLTVGARYAHMEQDFRSLFSSNDFRTVDTNVQFDGAGLRIGIDFERHAASCGVFAYGKGFANFLGGNFDTTYEQSSFQSGVEVDTYWQDLRIVTILEMELGLGWQSPCGHWRTTAGYMVQGWFNMVTTENWIDAVQASEFTEVGNAVGFDGLTARVEYRF